MRGEERPQLLAERIGAQPADQRGRCAELCRGHRLVCALAAREIMHGVAGHGLADLGMPVAVATTSMLMLPATKTRPMLIPKCLVPKFLLAPDLEFALDGVDIGKRRQSSLVAEALDLVGRGRARKLEMVLPAFRGLLRYENT